jgi:putative lipoprotein
MKRPSLLLFLPLSSLLVVLVIILTAVGCGNRDAVSDGSKHTFRGHLSIIDGTLSFTPCGMDELLQLSGRTAVLKDLYESLVPEPGGELYAVLKGRREAIPIEATGEPYDGRLAVTRASFVARESMECEEDLQGVLYRAQGNEPFWTLTIANEEIVFSELGRPGHRVFPLESPRMEGRTIEFRSTVGEHEILGVIEDTGCRDEMSGSFFSHRAEVSLDGTVYRGCAREGWKGSRE